MLSLFNLCWKSDFDGLEQDFTAYREKTSDEKTKLEDAVSHAKQHLSQTEVLLKAVQANEAGLKTENAQLHAKVTSAESQLLGALHTVRNLNQELEAGRDELSQKDSKLQDLTGLLAAITRERDQLQRENHNFADELESLRKAMEEAMRSAQDGEFVKQALEGKLGSVSSIVGQIRSLLCAPELLKLIPDSHSVLPPPEEVPMLLDSVESKEGLSERSELDILPS